MMATPVPLQAGGSWCAHAVPAPARASRVARVPLARARPDAALPFLGLPSLESLNRLTIALRYAAGLPRRATRRIVRRPSSRFVPLADLATRASVGMRQRTAHAQGWSRRSLETTRGLRRAHADAPAESEERDVAGAADSHVTPAVRDAGPSLQRCTMRSAAMSARAGGLSRRTGRLREAGYLRRHQPALGCSRSEMGELHLHGADVARRSLWTGDAPLGRGGGRRRPRARRPCGGAHPSRRSITTGTPRDGATVIARRTGRMR